MYSPMQDSFMKSVCRDDCPEGYAPALIDGACSCSPIETNRIYCPEGSVFEDNKCRKIVCPYGELYRGICLQVMCPPGMVWRGKKCQEPEYLTTILEIENLVTNEVRKSPVYLEFRNQNKIVQQQGKNSSSNTIFEEDMGPENVVVNGNSVDINGEIEKSESYTTMTSNTQEINNETKMSEKLVNSARFQEINPSKATIMPTNFIANTNPQEKNTGLENAEKSIKSTNSQSNDEVTKVANFKQTVGCCKLRTSRICKLYGQKWICFNRNQNMCDARVCTAPIVYLRPPEIKYMHSTLIMPPTTGPSTQGNNNVPADCSGCSLNQPENCSNYCSSYMCPKGVCKFMDLEEYCRYYPGKFGCIQADGCLWSWC
ncbi:uncharacterized protein isoform X2 [Musca autumnalis]|uniref:uncharacterized protein isoform X2 n=1 Tax=Musca autumnalis TaxID=221902 RepID=UPI003CE98550